MQTVTNPEGKTRISLVQDPAFVGAIEGMPGFLYEMNPDIDMAYDYVCEVANCHSFVDDAPAWDLFYAMWEVVQEENELI